MHQKINKLKRIMIILIAIQLVILAVLWLWLKQEVLLPFIVVLIEGGAMFYLFEQFQSVSEEQSIGVKNALGSTAREAYLSGGIGILIYDDDYVVTWMSELFAERGIDRVGYKLLTWVPEADDLISGKSDTVTVNLDDRIYEIRRKEDAQIIFFKDITELSNYKERYANEHVVIGMLSFDNYEESTQYLDEGEVSAVNMAVRTPVNEYCSQHGILFRRLNNHNRYMLVLNEKIFNDLVADHFSILNKVRKAAQKMDVSITLSMAFARGSSDFLEMDEMVSNLMDLATTRGGDQVAVQAAGGEVKYFGGSSEAAEKRSRVRVRVMSHALRDLMLASSNVIVCGHKTADFDCIGSALCLSRMASALRRPCVIIAKTGGIEEKLEAAMKANEAELKKEVTFVTEGEAINQLQENTLVIMTDHHNVKQSNGAKVLELAKKVVVIDHHRRSTDMGVKPVLVYIEAGASSTCELLTEMIPFVSRRTDISETAATFMLAGMIIDTQRWRVRTGARTYEAASELRKIGADPQKAYDYLKDTYDEFALKSSVMSNSEKLPGGIMIAPVSERGVSRSLISQVADSLLSIQDVNAAFVIADNEKGETCISARSNGSINVQRIMEMMGGGGHLAAAALQRPKTTVEALRTELISTLETYFKEEKADESDS